MPLKNKCANNPFVLIDDDEEDTELFTQVVKSLAIPNPILTFTNWAEALAYLKNTTEKPFVIVCDINMPMMNGLQLRKELFGDKGISRKSLPFVFLSTDTTPLTVEKAYDLSVQGFFKKEDSLKEIRNTFKRIIDYWSTAKNPNCNNVS